MSGEKCEVRTPARRNTGNESINNQEIKDKGNAKTTKEVKTKTATYNMGESVPYWSKVLDQIKQNGKIMIYTNLIGTRAVQLDDMTIGIEFPNKISEFANKVLNEHENKALIEKFVSMEAGNTMRVKYLSNSTSNNETKQNELESIVNKLDIPINIIDE